MVELCGDNITASPTEQCDDGPLGSPTCSPLCLLVACGNGILEPGEACDDGNIVSNDGCSSACLLENCGDGIVQPVKNASRLGLVPVLFFAKRPNAVAQSSTHQSNNAKMAT